MRSKRAPAARRRRGIFLTLEGPEGAGKTTQGRLLTDHLRGLGYDVLHVREPGGTVIGEQIRTLLLDPRYRGMAAPAEMLLFAAARAQLVAEVIAPALRQGRCVVCDRYVDASLAYQGVGRGLGIEIVQSVNAVATGGIVPDLTLLLDLDVAAGLRRARAESSARRSGAGGENLPGRSRGDRMEQEGLEFHRRVRQGFLLLAQKEPQRIKVIDARGSVAAVQREIKRTVQEFLRGRMQGPDRKGSR